ncbi:LLM class flavin-dependent oxidoreductase [Azotobacter beijerinckii]|uniref:LLM class flavin-dependent oxidoreductase n=1 Tax=Azotobacter beijerinckii TaxID=170623 RepID=UPI002954891F|nr:LLM class flavin-dependent oxidoreductase [Azotobacter beijerinckii]MDV7212551.1 LLM class flavin-dependent oxidoreductase [Azotobacter beijerinckii]
MSATHRVEFIGFLSHREASEARPGDGPLVNKAFLGACARAQEHAGFDRALIAYHSTAPDGLQVAAQAAQETRRLGLLVAHRPGVIAPTVAARQFATFDHFSDGRAAINIISGGDAAEQRRDGDFLDHDERYARTDEYLDVLKHAWRSREPFDFEGRYYRVKEHFAQVQPLQAHLPIYFSGSSPAALKVAGRHADVFMMWGEPLAGIAEQIAAVGVSVEGLAARTAAADDQLRRLFRRARQGQAQYLALPHLTAQALEQLVRAQRLRARRHFDGHHPGIEKAQQLALVGQDRAGHAHHRQHQAGSDAKQPVQLEKDLLRHLISPDRCRPWRHGWSRNAVARISAPPWWCLGILFENGLQQIGFTQPLPQYPADTQKPPAGGLRGLRNPLQKWRLVASSTVRPGAT